MNVGIEISGQAVDEDEIARLTRELLRDVRSDAAPEAHLVTTPSADHTKGDAVSVGQIALALVSGGAISKLIQAVFGFLGRHRKLEIEVQNAPGKKMKIKWDYIDERGEKAATELVHLFLKQDK